MSKRSSLIIGIIISLIVAFSIYFLAFPHPSIAVEITGPTDVQLGDQFTCNVTVTNTGNRDLFNVSVTDSYGFRWDGNLAIGESETFFMEFNGSTGEDVVNEVRVEGYTGERGYVRDQTSWTVVIVRPLVRYDLLRAVDEEVVDVEFRGRGYCSGDAMKLKITPKLDAPIEIEITPGLILINSGPGQNMITAEASIMTVKPETELDLDVEAYCLDLHKDNPSSEETFSIQTDLGTYAEDVVKLMKSLEDVPYAQKSVRAIQIALWVITDDISKEDIRIDHSTGDIEDAQWLLENAGIDISGKRLFAGA